MTAPKDVSKATPGPWHVGKREPTRVFDAGGKLIVDCDPDHTGWPIFEDRAALIAAAPAMREALERAEKRLKSLRYEVHNDSLAGNEYQAAMIDGDLDAIRAALNSADGVKP